MALLDNDTACYDDTNSMAYKVNTSATVITKKEGISNTDRLDTFLFEVEVSDKLKELCSNSISNGALFTLIDICSGVGLECNDSLKRNSVSVTINMTHTGNTKPVVGDKFYIKSVSDSIVDNKGFATVSLYNNKLELFAKGDHIVFFFDNKP